MSHKKRDKQKSQLQIARSARRKYQCKNLRSSGPEDDPGDQTRNRPEDHTILHRSSWQVICPSWDRAADMGVNKKWEFLLHFSLRKKCVLQRKSEDIQEISGICVFLVVFVAFLIMCSHFSTTFCVAWLSSDLHASLWKIEAWQTYLLQDFNIFQPSTEKNLSAGPFWNFPPDSGWVCSDPQQQLPLSCIAKWGCFRLWPCGSPCGNIRGKIWKYDTKQWQMFIIFTCLKSHRCFWRWQIVSGNSHITRSGGSANQEACLQVRVRRGQNSTLGFLAKANLNQAATAARHCSPSQFFTDRHGRCEWCWKLHAEKPSLIC